MTKTMHRLKLTTSFIAGMLAFSSLGHAEEANPLKGKEIEVKGIPFLITGYNRMVEGKDIYDLEGWQDMSLDRHHLEMLVFNVAPILGGCECTINMTGYEIDTPHSRSIEQVKSGSEISHAVGVFSGDSRIEDGLWISDPILDAEDFYVGLYTHAGRSEILAINREADVKKLKFGVGSSWEIDRKVIEAYGLEEVPADNWRSLIFMLKAGRADVMMQPFHNTPDFGFTEEEQTEKFLPIPNMRMRFPQGRVFFVSKEHPDGQAFYEALNKGIQILKEDDFLQRAHEWAGVLNPRTEEFEIIFD